jgi:hypothetical protein
VVHQKIPHNLEPASSVMEYQVFEEAAMTGHIMSRTQRMLDYDRKVMEALYLGKEFKPEEVPLFCSDSQTDLLDCQTFDLGRNPIEAVAFTVSQQQSTLVQSLFNSILKAKRIGQDPALFVDSWATRLLSSRVDLLALTGSETPLLQVRRKYANPDDYAYEKILAEELALMQNALEAQGGWNKLLALPTEKELKDIPFALRKMMRDYEESLDDQKLSFSLEEQTRYETLMHDFVARLQRELPKAQWEKLATASEPLANNVFTDGLLTWVADEARTLLLKTQGMIHAKRVNADGRTTDLLLPNFVADSTLRLQVATTLARLPAEASWKVAALKESLKDELREMLDTYLPESSSIKYKELDATAQEWRATEQAVIRALSL